SRRAPVPCCYVTDTAPTVIYTLSLHDALPISSKWHVVDAFVEYYSVFINKISGTVSYVITFYCVSSGFFIICFIGNVKDPQLTADRKSTRLNSSHVKISYAVFCLKKKTAKDGT